MRDHKRFLTLPNYQRGMQFARVSRSEALGALAVASCYFAVASIVILTSRAGPGLAVIWPATAILLVQLAVAPRRAWPILLAAVGVASCLATGFFGLGWKAALPLAAFNVSEALIGAWALKLRAERASFDSLGGFAYFLLVAGLCAPAISGLGGALMPYLLGQDYWLNWLRWTTGHGLGTMICAPLIWLIYRREAWRIFERPAPGDIARHALALSAVGAVALAVFLESEFSLLFVTILPVMLTTFATGRLGTALALILLAAIGAVCTFQGYGPVAALDNGDAVKIIYFQGFLAVLVLTVLPVAAELQNRRKLNSRLAQSEARYRLLTESSSDIILNLNAEGIITFASPSVTALGGYSEEEVVGRTALDLVHPDFAHAAADAFRRTLLHPEQTQMIEYLARTKDGSDRWFESNMKAVIGDDGELLGAVNSIRNIDHRKAREEELYSAAGTDMLTRLLNRSGFIDALEHFLGTGERGCLALFDIDNFRAINDRHGRHAGDQMLRKLADAARNSVRSDDLVGRIGGEEFAVLLPRAGRTEAVAVCERLRCSAAVLSLPGAKGRNMSITVSAGVIEIAPGEQPQRLLDCAEAALEEAKQAGRNRLVLAA